ncbi:Metal binding domain of Ada [Paraburkholderia caballeronis]|uniref:Metal binding domain of Ada n=1 Tax=Paraburkholderia caballeronis TaxID=416943 RepID=A0A1H7H608_9BURK|nr:metal binding Ada-like protein [Paraburkholderia caballeronis]PXX04908.1 metal binding Ada-like protein [Paraburkholderia caballeronis]RAK05969.1 metal binding Ada-like protein [Paraburkholderia caballeronis]TDV37363.1 metal binding Ada-like protein [Paraburkholderia caballeronis]SEB45164.1 Metal binding domain of Ada [Paraburkholderia caballeronis]
MGYSRAMNIDPDTCYAAILAKDRRFDGWFFVGVSSTGVYCRPVCPVRPPKRRNCHFYATHVFLGETITPTMLAGCAIVLFGTALASGKIRLWTARQA